MNATSEDWLQPYQQSLLTFNHQIEAAIAQADWESLEHILNARQTFLENLANVTIADAQRAALKLWLQDILHQDTQYIAQIEAQKHGISQQQSILETGRRAVQAYTNV